MAILKVENLNKAFGGLQATNDVNYEMQTGELSGIIGPNGAGKSTFFNLLTGYYKVDSGRIAFQGKDITNWSPHKISRLGIARAFQVSNIYPALTTYENVRQAIRAFRPYAVDVSSGVETRPGIKNHRLLKEFIRHVKK